MYRIVCHECKEEYVEGVTKVIAIDNASNEGFKIVNMSWRRNAVFVFICYKCKLNGIRGSM